MKKTKSIVILTSHNEDFDFEYIDLIKGISRYYDVHLICSTAYQGQLCSLNLKIHRIDCKSKLDFSAISKIRNLIKSNQIDLMYTQTNRLLAAAIFSTYGLKHPPHIFVRRGICAPVYKYRIEDLLTYFSKRLKHVLTISDAAKKSLIDGGYPQQKVTTVRPSLSPDYFSESIDATIFKEENNIPQDATVIMCIANKRFVKGLDRILEAAEQLANKNIYWCLIGWGCDQRLLDDLKKNKPQKVRLLGFIEHAYRYLDACDIYVQPSRLEGLSYSLMQALLKEKCPVISRAGGMTELVESGYNGLTFSNDDASSVKELVANILTLIKNPDLKDTLAARGKNKLQTDFSAPIMLNKTLEIFEHYSK